MQRPMLGGLIAAIAALPLAASAEQMSYTYVDLGYINTELDDGAFDVDGDGFALRGLLQVHENFFVFAEHENIGYDFDVDGTSWHVGGGGRWPLSESLDVVGRLGFVKAEVEVGQFDADDDGFALGARLRGAVAPRFELEGGIDYVNLDDSGDDTSLVLEGRYFFLPQLAGGLLLGFNSDATTIGVGARYTF
jgi:hypothetical protein